MLCNELSGLHYLWDMPWCICGYFNTTRFPSGREGNSPLSSAMENFSRLIFDLDLPLVGGEYTWSNRRGGSRLDRFLVSSSWESHYPRVSQKRMPTVCSDHFPILLDCGGIIEAKCYFKFENMWLQVEGFVDKVRSWWHSCYFEGTPSFVLASKLRALKADLKMWNKDVFGNVEQQKKSLGKSFKP
ncbi:hypothetical protein CIPAW_09G221600 [Carya illinoinensis]|uniref:Uncharacterized protein n=1 Tax=Carya illinoinensis TaxID=32201 RepID=A0A8T1PQL6_CARIL|nr:hypothetical protein CIPAW_09G221600 [Carya illinoinensis]